jgi:biopolymer transport protein ExbD
MSKRRVKKQKEAHLIIVSLIDVFVIVLVFLMRSISAEGNLMTSADNLVLPMSARSKSPTEVSLTIITDQKHVTVDDKQLMETTSVRAQDSLLVKPVYDILIQKREEEKKAEVLGIIKESTGKVVVQFDKNTPYDIVTKIMATCGYSGYSNIKFAVTKIGDET